MLSCLDGINGLLEDQAIERGVIASLQNDISLLCKIKNPFLEPEAARREALYFCLRWETLVFPYQGIIY